MLNFCFPKLAAGPGPMNINTPYRYLWIGLTDVTTEGTYVWNSTGQVATYSYWVPGQPDNYYNEDFILMGASEAGLWSDVADSYNGAATMCEQSVTQALPSNMPQFYSSLRIVRA